MRVDCLLRTPEKHLGKVPGRRVTPLSHLGSHDCLLLLATRGALNPNLQAVITHASHAPWVPEAFHARFPVSVKS